MTLNRNRTLIVPTAAVLSLSLMALASADGFLGGLIDVWGSRYIYAGPPASELLPTQRVPRVVGDAASSVRYWNRVAMDANAIDHTPPVAGESRSFGEQLGPGRTTLAFAIIHIAIFDAVNAIAGGYRSYTGLDPAPPGSSMEAAIAQAAHDTLVAMFPSQSARMESCSPKT